MFYVKEKLNDTTAVSIGITDENVFCHCPMCGTEVSVDIAEILSDGESDLFSTAVFCDACGKKVRSGGRHYENK